MGRKPKGKRIDKWATPAALLQIQSWGQRGMTKEQIAEKIGISRRQLDRWASANPGIKTALENGKEAAVAAVENALFKKAASGDLGAICFYLKNRAPEHWSEHPEYKGLTGVIFEDDIPRPQPSGKAARGGTGTATAQNDQSDLPGVLSGA